MNAQQTYNNALDQGATHTQAAKAVEKADQPKMLYRAVWHREDGKIEKGHLIDFETAADEVLFLEAVGRITWLQDDQDNRIELGKAVRK